MNELAESPWPADTRMLRVGDIEIDLRYRSVHRNGTCNELNPRCFDLLLLFLREPHVLHTRDAIFLKVWPGVIVEDASLTTSIWMLRRALGGVARQWIRTVSRQGYVFDPPASAPIRACVPEPDTAGGRAPTLDEAPSATLAGDHRRSQSRGHRRTHVCGGIALPGARTGPGCRRGARARFLQ